MDRPRNPVDIRRQLVAEAGELVTGDRNATHGNYTDEATRIGQAWAAILRLPEPIPPHVVAALMVVLKMCRATAGAANVDDWRDGIGYCANGAQIDVDTRRVP
jgi:hypothetical protein